MHMHNGLGRTGYLLLALVLFLIGGLGVAVTVLAFETGVTLFVQIGVALAAVGLIGLFGFAASAPWLDAPRKRLPLPETGSSTAQPSPATKEPRQASSPSAPAPSAATEFEERAGPTFEFDDVHPAAKAAPTEMVMPPAFQKEKPAGQETPSRDPAAWPQERGTSAWSAQRRHEARLREDVEDSPVRREMQERYTRNTPMIRSMLQDEAPLQIAERAPEDVGPGFAAPGMSVGRCGRCKTALLAPDERPLRLKCPECAKVTLLE